MKSHLDTQSLALTLAVYVLIFALKLGVYFISGVMALFAETMHTLSDIFVSGFLLLATLYSRKAADQEHMFGHARVQNVAALVAATLFISFTSFELYREAIPRLFQPEAATHQNLPWVIGVILLSMVIAAAPLAKLVRQKERGAAAKAQLMELINDELGLLAALIGTLFIAMGWPIADPLAAIIVATIIAFNAAGLFRENSSALLGRSPGSEYLAVVESTARAVPGVLDVHDLRAEEIGPGVIHAGLSITVQRGTPIEEADRISEQVKQSIHQDLDLGYCLIHVDPSEPAGKSQGAGFEASSATGT